MPRRQLPVSSPIQPLALVRAIAPAVSGNGAQHDIVARALTAEFGARGVALTDSGTSALVLALRLAVPPGGTVAFPGYGCIDLAAAALYAGVRVRLYDIDPVALSPDLDSLEQTLRRGAHAVVVAHLYGVPSDMVAVRALVATHGVALIEDAAQGAGGTLHSTRLGAFGPLSVLSFGRGKGTTGGNGGALLALTDDWAGKLAEVSQHLGEPPAGWRDLAAAAVQWVLGRPSLYPIPAAIPSLRLGEMVYHPAGEPRALSRAAASLVRTALASNATEVARRRGNAAKLARRATGAPGLRAIKPIDGAEPGWLRFPVLDDGRRGPAPELGVMAGYPQTLMEQAELRPILHSNETGPPGAIELRRSLLTLPTHGMVTPADLNRLYQWITQLPSAL